MLTKTQIASPLSRKATLVGVTISQWTARKLDRKVTDKLNREHNAKSDTTRVNKLLIEAKRLEKINGVVTKARQLHYTLTKPWADEGLRILPNVLHGKFLNEFRVLEREFETAVDEFCEDFSAFVEERRLVMGTLFNANDYPQASQIRSKFKLSYRTFPVPEADDFRSDVLDQDTIEDIKREIAETSESVLTGAIADTKDQIVKVVGHMSERLAEYANKKEGDRTGTFRDSLVENVRELADLLPAFNFNNDPAFDALTKRIQKELCVEDAKTLRTDSDVRDSVKKSADDILKSVESLLG